MASQGVKWGRPMGTGGAHRPPGQGEQKRSHKPRKRRTPEDVEKDQWDRARSHSKKYQASHGTRKDVPEDPLDAYMAHIDKELLSAQGPRQRSEGELRMEQLDREERDRDEREERERAKVLAGMEGALGALALDCPCLVHSLTGARAKFNSKVGRVVDWNEKKQVLFGLKQRPELNGRVGAITGFDSHSQRVRVRLVPLAKKHKSSVSGGDAELPSELALRSTNLIYPPETRVKLCGLVQAAEHNGTWGTVVDVDDVACRYTVRVSEALSLKPKFGNCAT